MLIGHVNGIIAARGWLDKRPFNYRTNAQKKFPVPETANGTFNKAVVCHLVAGLSLNLISGGHDLWPTGAGARSVSNELRYPSAPWAARYEAAIFLFYLM